MRVDGPVHAIVRLPLLAALVLVSFVAAIVALVVVSNRNGDGAHAQPTHQLTASGSPTHAATPSRSPGPPSTSPVARTSLVPTTPPPSRSTKPPLTYTIRKGDNLTVIAAWFRLHGYGELYQRNRAVIGDDPNLIYPGQRITISSAGMTVTH